VKQVLVRGGSVLVQQVPAPYASPKNLLVRVAHSCISIGTEMAGVRMSGLPLYRRALKQPHHVTRVLGIMRDQGIKRTWDRVRGQLAAGLPTGYSAAGEVLEVGEQVTGFRPGELVACAGAGVANHAELIDVPVNLAVRIPGNLGTELASTVTLGSIAMQGVRRANPTLGETIVVIGLGLLGQITAQLLKANGCRVVGSDPDVSRVQTAVENGLDFGIISSDEDLAERVYKLTDGFGADAAIITAAAAGNEVISLAMQVCRKKGRVVLVGDVGLGLNREDFYKKELDFLISCSYGPGRYDPIYEEGGQDYPLPYVRWTENRNMEEYLRLLAEGRISLANFNPEIFNVDRAEEAYELLKNGTRKPLLALLAYPQNEKALERTVAINRVQAKAGCIRVAVAGAGAFAQAMHLPNLLKLPGKFQLQCVMSRTGANARGTATQFGAAYATTDYDQVLRDPAVDLVMIATRHDLHGRMVLQALGAGKHVFVEKPLTIFPAELDEIERFYRTHPHPPLLMTGFNRRFSPAIQMVQEQLAKRTTPLIVNYRMNAGFIPRDHWVHSEQGGGRNLGEACHIYDLFNALTSADPMTITAHSIVPGSKQWGRNDNFVATVTYSDGSVCTLSYTALGHKSFPKETMEVFSDGKVISMQDYKSVVAQGNKRKTWNSMTQEKGQKEELQSLAEAIQQGKIWPITLKQQIQATRIAFAVENQIATVQGSRGSIDDGQ